MGYTTVTQNQIAMIKHQYKDQQHDRSTFQFIHLMLQPETTAVTSLSYKELQPLRENFKKTKRKHFVWVT